MTDVGDEAMWRRPAEGAAPPSAPLLRPEQPQYSGPPPTVRPPQRPLPAPLIQPLPPPRQLPAQDHQAIDQEERQAQLVSYGVAIVAGVLMLLLVLLAAIRNLAV